MSKFFTSLLQIITCKKLFCNLLSKNFCLFVNFVNLALVINVDIYYTNETLYVKMNNITSATVNIMQKRVFRIIEDYNIDNIVLRIPKLYDDNSDILSSFVNAYHKIHNGNLRIL